MLSKNKILFLQVHDDILARIRSGEYSVNSQLPTEQALMDQYNVSITTIRKAVQMLSDSNVVAKRQGMGTFVCGYPEKSAQSSELAASAVKVAVFFSNTVRLTSGGDSRHWMLNLRRLNGIYAAAAKKNAHVFVHSYSEIDGLDNCNAAILIGSYMLEEESLRRNLVSELEKRRIPFVTVSVLDARFTSKWWLAEMLEIEFFKATEYLIKNGHHRIGFIGPWMGWKNPRYVGFRKALDFYGIKHDESIEIDNHDADEPSGFKACEKLLDNAGSKIPDAIFCTTDLQAYGVMNCLNSRGISIPDDVSVMGCDNLLDSANCSVPLTSIEFSGPMVGEAAIELLLEAMHSPDSSGRIVSSPDAIIERKSVKNRNKDN